MTDHQDTADPSEPTLVYSHDGIDLWQGDCGLALPMISGVDLILTDPPWHYHGYTHRVETAATVSDVQEADWWKNLWAWNASWMTRLRTTGCERGWIFCGWHQISPVLRVADIIGWPVQHVFVLAGQEYLLYAGHERLSRATVASVDEAYQRTPMSNRKDLGFLRRLLQISRPSRVLEPFAGEGSTLIACRQARIPAVGIELRQQYAHMIMANLEGRGELTSTP